MKVIAIRQSSTQRALDWLELCKPRLSSLVLLTVAAGFYCAVLTGAAVAPGPSVLIGALLGVALCAAGAATLNQVIERNLDAMMERTKDRPLAAGRIAPEAAAVFGVVCIAAGTLLLNALCGSLAAGLGFLSAALYVAVYTPLKRVTTFNTLVGAVVGALPPMIGWVAVTGNVGTGAWVLFAILFVWQLPHFFAIAWFYREDYGRAGMRMLAVGDHDGRVTMRQIMLFTLVLLPVSLTPTVYGLAGERYFFAALILGIGLVGLGVHLVRARSQRAARNLFLGSLVYLPCLLSLMLADAVSWRL